MNATWRLSATRPALIGAAAALAVLAIWYELLWAPQSARLASARLEQASASQSLVIAQQRLGHLKHLQSISAQMRTLDSRLAAAIPDSDALDTFIVGLNDDARVSGVALGSLSFSPAAPTTAGMSAIGVQASVTGGYFGLERFLDHARDGDRLVVLDTMALSPSGASSPDGTVSTMNLVFHVLVARPGSRSTGTP